ncbi:MAG: hypothetical protein K8R76_11330 [Candidatus Aegiribacteria sp.]|nr:hypothetical protein [Candidatus Aegiribacteria sp.]
MRYRVAENGRSNPALRRITFILILLMTLTGHASSQDISQSPFLLAEDVQLFTPISEKEVLFVDSSGEIRLVNIDHPLEPIEWSSDWDPRILEWSETGRTLYLSSSIDGEWVCFAISVDTPGLEEVGPAPLAVVVSRSDGSGSKTVALAQNAGGGPQFSFSSDTNLLYGYPFMPCGINASDYIAYMSGETAEEQYEFYTIIDLRDGSRFHEDLPLSSGYIDCPFSDLAAIANEGSLLAFARISAEGSFIDFYGGSYLKVLSWVLPDGLLAEHEGKQFLVLSDGTLLENTTEWLNVRCWVSDALYLCSTGESCEVLLTGIDWENFEPVHGRILEDFPREGLVMSMPGSEGLLIADYDKLFYYPLLRGTSSSITE